MKMDKTTYMTAIIHKLLEDIKAKEIDYGTNGVKVQILLGRDEAQVLLDALEKDGKEPFINKPCISEGVCHEDKVNVLNKIIAEIWEEAEWAYSDFEEYKQIVLEAEIDELPDDEFRFGLHRAVEIINKYITESEKE